MGSTKRKKVIAKEESAPSHEASEDVAFVIDEDHSQLPFFQVYRVAGTSTLESSMQRALTCEAEVILAKLFVTNRYRQHQQLTFTNRRIIVLDLSTPLGCLWQMVSVVEKIPVIGWILDIFLGMLKALVGHWLKRDRRNAERLSAVADEAILPPETLPKKITWRIRATSVPYAKIVQPSLGITIQQRWFAFYFTKIRGATLRFIPVGRLRSALNKFWDAADYLLPERSIVDRLVPVLRAVKPHLPFGEIDLTETDGAVSVRWPAKVGVGASRWSVRGANAVTIGLAAITLFLFFVAVTEDDDVFLSAVVFGVATSLSLAERRFSAAMVYVLIIIVIVLGVVVRAP